MCLWLQKLYDCILSDLRWSFWLVVWCADGSCKYNQITFIGKMYSNYATLFNYQIVIVLSLYISGISLFIIMSKKFLLQCGLLCPFVKKSEWFVSKLLLWSDLLFGEIEKSIFRRWTISIHLLYKSIKRWRKITVYLIVVGYLANCILIIDLHIVVIIRLIKYGHTYPAIIKLLIYMYSKFD